MQSCEPGKLLTYLIAIIIGLASARAALAQEWADTVNGTDQKPLQGSVKIIRQDDFLNDNLNPGCKGTFGAAQNFDSIKGSARQVNAQCAEWIKANHPEFLSTAANITPKTILEINSCDHFGSVLNSFGIPYTKIKDHDLEKSLTPETKVLIIDCCWFFRIHKLRKESTVIKNFVNSGGCLIATGWSSYIVEDIFPEYVKVRKTINGPGKGMGNIDIEQACDNTRLFAGCWRNSRMMTCSGTKVIIPLSKDVVPLLSSADLARKTKNLYPYAAIAFHYGHGYVLDTVGHLQFNQLAGENLPVHRGSLLAEFVDDIGPREIGTAQLMTINFILECLKGSS